MNPTDSEQKAAYTILYYGHGGGNREYFYLNKIADFYNAGPDALKRVNVVAQYKFSTTNNLYVQGFFSDNSSVDSCQLYGSKTTYSKPSIDGAYRMIPQVLCQPMVDIEKALDAYCKACVNSWDVAFGTETDDTTPNYTDMTVTRTASIPQLGKMLREFTDRLCNTYTNGTDAQRAAIDYCTARATKVQLNQANYDAVKYVRSIITALPEVYGDDFYNQMKEAFNNCILAQYFSHYLTVHEYMVDYSVLLGAEGSYAYIYWKDNLYTNSKEPYAAEFYDDNGDMQLYKLTPTENPEYYSAEPSGNVSYWGSTLAETYEQLAFDRIVGWSRWLRLNKQWPNMFCPKDMNFELPMPKTEDF